MAGGSEEMLRSRFERGRAKRSALAGEADRQIRREEGDRNETQQIDFRRADSHGGGLSADRDDPGRTDYSYPYSRQKAVFAATSIAEAAAIHSVTA